MRADGKRIKNVDAMYTIIPYILDKRNDAMNMVTVNIPYEPIHNYLLNIRKNGHNISHMGLIIAAYLRVVSEFPSLNRFIMNKKIYARNEFTVSMVILKPGHNEETIAKLHLNYTDTVFDVQNKINNFLEENRKHENENSTDKLAAKLVKIPGLLNVSIGFLKWADKHGFIPKALIDASPFHSGMVLSNLASIRTNHIYHHCYNFGTISIVVTIGNLVEIPKVVNKELTVERCIPLGIVMDERICDGVYFAKAFKSLSAYLKNPSLLEVPPETIDSELK